MLVSENSPRILTMSHTSAVPSLYDDDGRRFRLVSAWLFVVAAMIFVMIVLGGVTRLTHSGLSMVEWKVNSDLFEGDIQTKITAQAAVAARQTPQSTNPAAVEHALSCINAWLEDAWVESLDG